MPKQEIPKALKNSDKSKNGTMLRVVVFQWRHATQGKRTTQEGLEHPP